MGGRGCAPPPAFHTMATDMSLNRGATHTYYTWTEAMYFLILYLIDIYLRPPLKITQLRPWSVVGMLNNLII